MHYRLLGFSQKGSVRSFSFQRIGDMGIMPVPFGVVVDVNVLRKFNLPLQELPNLCSWLLQGRDENAPPETLSITEADVSTYAAQSAVAATKK